MRGDGVEKIYQREIDNKMARELSYRIAGVEEWWHKDFAREDLFVNEANKRPFRGRWLTTVQSSSLEGNVLSITLGPLLVETYDVAMVLGAMSFLIGTYTWFNLMRVAPDRFRLTLHCNPELLDERWRWLLDFFPPEHSPEAVFEAEKLLGNAS